MHKSHLLIAMLIASQFACASTNKAYADGKADEPAFSSAGSPSQQHLQGIDIPRQRFHVEVGDAFSGFMDVEQEIDEERYSSYRANDPFSSGIPSEQLVSLSKGIIGPGAFLKKLAAPRVESADNLGTIGPSDEGGVSTRTGTGDGVFPGKIFGASNGPVVFLPNLKPASTAVRGVNTGRSSGSRKRARKSFSAYPFPHGDIFTTAGGDAFSSTPSTGYQEPRNPNLHPSSEAALYTDEIIGPPAWRAEQMPLKVYISRSVEAAREGYAQNVIYETLKQSSAETKSHVTFQVTYKYQEADIFYVCQECEGSAEQSREARRGVLNKVKIAIDLSTLWRAEPKRLRRICLEQAKYAFGELGTPVPKPANVASKPKLNVANASQAADASGPAFAKPNRYFSMPQRGLPIKNLNKALSDGLQSVKPLVAHALSGFTAPAASKSGK